METPVVFSSNGQQLVGVLHLPDAVKAQVPGVVFFHGFTGNKAEVRRIFVRVARALASRGIASLRFDFRGSGDSEGEFSKMRMPGVMKDAFAAIEFLREHSAIDSARVGLVGFSMGGMVGARVLAKAKAESFKAAVFWSSVSQPGALLDESYEHAGTMLDLGGWLVSRAFMRQYAEVKPLEELAKAKLSTRVLLIHGTDDEHVPLEHSMDYQRAFEAVGAKVALNVIEGATHTYETIEQDREVVQRTVRWLVRNL